MRGRSVAVLMAALLAGGGALVVAASSGPAAPTFEEQVDAIASSLRCPVCQNLSVADSDSPAARAMRREIAAGIRGGETQEEIVGRFVASYGEWILQAPPRRGLHWVVWVTPAAALVVGVAVVAAAIRRWTSRRVEGPA